MTPRRAIQNAIERIAAAIDEVDCDQPETARRILVDLRFELIDRLQYEREPS